MPDRCAYCRPCGIYFEMPAEFDERIQKGVCPTCNGTLLLTQRSLAQATKDLGLDESEIGTELATVAKG
jgi:hypothetical protein